MNGYTRRHQRKFLAVYPHKIAIEIFIPILLLIKYGVTGNIIV